MLKRGGDRKIGKGKVVAGAETQLLPFSNYRPLTASHNSLSVMLGGVIIKHEKRMEKELTYSHCKIPAWLREGGNM